MSARLGDLSPGRASFAITAPAKGFERGAGRLRTRPAPVLDFSSVFAKECSDERVDLRDRAEVCRHHDPLRDRNAELGFYRQHEIDYVERRKTALGQIVMVSDGSIDAALCQQFGNEGNDSFGRLGVEAIEHGELLSKFTLAEFRRCSAIR
jgi:hypothetical protein